MLQYPKEYNLLNEEELEYTGGGSDADASGVTLLSGAGRALPLQRR